MVYLVTVVIDDFLLAEVFVDFSSDSFKSDSISSRYFSNSSDSAVPGTLVYMTKMKVEN